MTAWSIDLAAFSKVLDETIDAEGPNHLRRIRCSKSTEESGEIESELVALEGSNPRKPATTSTDMLVKELLDDATAALGALEHVTGNRGDSGRLLAEHCAMLRERACGWADEYGIELDELSTTAHSDRVAAALDEVDAHHPKAMLRAALILVDGASDQAQQALNRLRNRMP